MLFAMATTTQMELIMRLLEDFSAQSGLHVNVQKSRIMVSKNTPNVLARSLSAMSGVPLTLDLGIYLGIPIK